jgi:hypothetical protein
MVLSEPGKAASLGGRQAGFGMLLFSTDVSRAWPSSKGLTGSASHADEVRHEGPVIGISRHLTKREPTSSHDPRSVVLT